jgi:hypothetical protein
LIEFINQKIMIKTLFVVLFFALVLFAGVNAFVGGGHNHFRGVQNHRESRLKQFSSGHYWRGVQNHRKLGLKKSGKKIGRRAKKNTAAARGGNSGL